MSERISEHFGHDEVACNHCGEVKYDPQFIELLERLREKTGPLVATSFYRCPKHPLEAKKAKPGMHSTGKAVDLHPTQITVPELYRIVETFSEFQNGGVGVSLEDGYVHVDTRNGRARWIYRNRRDMTVSDPLASLGVA